MRRSIWCVMAAIMALSFCGLALAQDVTPAPEPTFEPLDEAQSAALPTLTAARADLELLASSTRGIDRPAGWSGNLDTANPQYAILLRLDLELLVGATLGADERPEGWFGVVPSTPAAVARDIRHDLELLADVVMNSRTVRPRGWQGDDPIMRCSRAVQTLIQIVELNGYPIQVNFNQSDYCYRAEMQASVFIETLNRTAALDPAAAAAALTVAGTGGTPTPSGFRAPYQAVGPFVVGFYDRRARRRGGVLPDGTQFNLIARSYTPFSKMMLVEGESFRLFVDYTFTNVSTDDFFALPEASESADFSTQCNLGWCEVYR